VIAGIGVAHFGITVHAAAMDRRQVA